MKKLVLFLATVLVVSTATAQTSLLTNGESIPIRITADIRSKSKLPQEVMAIVDKDIYSHNNDKVVIKRGTPVAVVSKIVRAKGMGMPGSIKIDFKSTTAIDGQTIDLIGGVNYEGYNRRGAVIATGCVWGILLSPFGFLWFTWKGDDVWIAENTIIQNVVVNNSYNIATE